MTNNNKETRRLRGKALQERNAAYLRRNPLCKRCLTGKCAHRNDGKECCRAAEQVDHIVPLFKGGQESKRADHPNLQGLCDACHEIKTREDLGHKHKPTIGLDGYPIS